MASTPSTNRNLQSTYYIHTCTMEKLLSEEQTQDAQINIATRPQGKGERKHVIWSAKLDASLLKGLVAHRDYLGSRPAAEYQYRKRNMFISNYILEATGERRTGKQISGRLRTLAKTGQIERLVQQIEVQPPLQTHKEADSTTVSSEEIVEGSSSMQVPWNHSHSTMHQGTSVLVELILESSRWSSALPAIQLANIAELQASPIPIHLSQLPTLLRFGQTPSRPTPSQLLCAMIPVVLFASPYALCSWYSCSVFSHGTELPVHTERVLLVCIACPPQSTGWIYTSTLAPGFWRALCSASSPTQYSIVQQVVPLTRTTTISIIYSLSYPEPFKKSENIETNQNIINDGILQPAHDYSHPSPKTVDHRNHGRPPISNSGCSGQGNAPSHVLDGTSFDTEAGNSLWHSSESTPTIATSGEVNTPHMYQQDGWTNRQYLAHFPTPLAPANHSYVPYQ